MIPNKKPIKIIFFWILLTNVSTICAMTIAQCDDTQTISYDSHARRDPFIPLNFEKKLGGFDGLEGVEGIDDIQVQGIVFDKSNGSIVIINGVVMNEGQTEGPVKVIQISQDGVTFQIKGQNQFKQFNAADASRKEPGVS